MQFRGNSRIYLSALLSLFIAASSLAGQLGDFEKAANKPKPASKSASKSASISCSDDDNFFFEVIFVVIGWALIETGKGIKWLAYDWWAKPDSEHNDSLENTYTSKATVTRGDASQTYEGAEAASEKRTIPKGFRKDPRQEETHPEYPVLEVTRSEHPMKMAPHRLGTAICPYLRFDYNLQYLETDSFANDYRLEAGYQAAAFYGRMTRYEDHNTKETINIDQYYLMLRSGNVFDPEKQAGVMGIDLGLGAYIIDGIQHQNSSMALTIPIKLYPTDYFGVEFRPAWTYINDRAISDYDISISGGYLYSHLRLGYRWLYIRGDGSHLKGPYAGLSISF